MAVRGVPGRAAHRFVPESVPGRWSVGLFLLFVAALVVFSAVAIAGAGTWEPAFFANLEATIPLLISAASALASAVVGIVAMVKKGDRSTAVAVATVVCGIVTLFFTGELLSVVGVLPQH